jgi:hypothetical protein
MRKDADSQTAGQSVTNAYLAAKNHGCSVSCTLRSGLAICR